MNRFLLFFCLLFLGFCFSSFAEDTISTLEKRTQIIKYGIDTEIIDLLKTLVQEKNNDYNASLNEVLIKTRNPKIKEALFKFFLEREWKGAEESALSVIRDRDNQEDVTTQAALSYLGSTKSPEAITIAVELIKVDEKKFISQAINLIGKSGSSEQEDILLAYWEKDPSEQLKQDILLALGGIGTEKSVDFLIKIVNDTAKTKSHRMYACTSLGKLKNDKAIPVLTKAINDQDAVIRQYAVEALASFTNIDFVTLFHDALRDSNAKVRIQAAQSIAKMKSKDFIDALIYRVNNDSEKKVKEECLKALMDINTNESITFVRNLLKDSKALLAMRDLAFSELMKKDRSASISVLKEEMISASKEKDLARFMTMVRVVSQAEGSGLNELVTVILSNKDYLVRIGALEYIKKNKLSEYKAVIENLSINDPNETIKKKALEIIKLL